MDYSKAACASGGARRGVRPTRIASSTPTGATPRKEPLERSEPLAAPASEKPTPSAQDAMMSAVEMSEEDTLETGAAEMTEEDKLDALRTLDPRQSSSDLRKALLAAGGDFKAAAMSLCKLSRASGTLDML